MSAVIAFHDFTPKDSTRMLALTRTVESVGAVMTRVNAWIDSNRVDVINVETLLLPVDAAANRDGDSAGEFTDNMGVSVGMFDIGTTRLQVVRVWYRSA